ncbi:MAG: nucleotide exchange factor GrpE, partial [Clostridiales bacterium]|nr:nucleotide exchange factor GrpE [Clostridiales bacterium]
MEEKKEYEQEQVTEETSETADPAAADAAEDGAEQTAETPDESGETSADDAADETADSADAADGEASDDSKADKGGFFRKKDKKDKKDEKIEELTDRVKRQMAEFDNFRKRTEKEKSQMFETGAKSIIEKVLPVIDNFERGLAAVPEEEKENPFVDGMEKIYRQMMTVLEEAGVKPIEAEGKEFDPNLHNAVMH